MSRPRKDWSLQGIAPKAAARELTNWRIIGEFSEAMQIWIARELERIIFEDIERRTGRKRKRGECW